RGDVLGVLKPGEHGSTFGGDPLACAVSRAVIALLRTGEFTERSASLGAHLHQRWGELVGRGVTAVRGGGLRGGVELTADRAGREVCVALAEHGVLCKETHGSTLRLAPPLVISESELDQGIDALAKVVGS